MQECKLEERQNGSHTEKNILSDYTCGCVMKRNYLIMVRV